MTEPRYCTNCRTELPPKADSCPACGTYAGDVFDGRLPGKSQALWWTLGILLVLGAAAIIWINMDQQLPFVRHETPRTTTAPVRVVRDRPGGVRKGPGAKINEAEAIIILRRHFIAGGMKTDCVAILSHGYRDGAYQFTVTNGCDRTRLGRWRVDGKTSAVSRAV